MTSLLKGEPQMSLRDIDDDVSRLVELDRPAWNACKVPGIRAFAPSRQQKKALGMFRHNWTRSLLNVIRYVPDQVRVELHKWLQIKREMFEEALRNVRRALHFDVLVLGILPVDPSIVLASLTNSHLLVDPAVEVFTRIRLADARQALSALHDPDSRASDGWAAQVETVYTRIYKLKDQYPIPDAEAEPFDVWYNQAKRNLAKEVHDAWPLLFQYGVRELLYFLYQALSELFNRGANERAFKMLREWLPRRILQRIEDTIRAAQNCATWLPGSPAPLQLLTSCNPRYFTPLALPHRVFGADVGHPLDLPNLLNPAEEERALGSQPRLGRRAAAHYRVNREAWERRAALRCR